MCRKALIRFFAPFVGRELLLRRVLFSSCSQGGSAQGGLKAQEDMMPFMMDPAEHETCAVNPCDDVSSTKKCNHIGPRFRQSKQSTRMKNADGLPSSRIILIHAESKPSDRTPCPMSVEKYIPFHPNHGSIEVFRLLYDS